MRKLFTEFSNYIYAMLVIQEISKEYRNAIQHATNYAKLYAEAEKEMREIIDLSTNLSKWKTQSAHLF